MINYLHDTIVEISIRVAKSLVGFLEQRIEATIRFRENFEVTTGDEVDEQIISVVVVGAEIELSIVDRHIGRKRCREPAHRPDFLRHMTASQVVHRCHEPVDKCLVYEQPSDVRAKDIGQRQKEVTVTVIKWWQCHEIPGP